MNSLGVRCPSELWGRQEYCRDGGELGWIRQLGEQQLIETTEDSEPARQSHVGKYGSLKGSLTFIRGVSKGIKLSLEVFFRRSRVQHG
jgi:hypothetical protein